jgi:hypothetical protein
MYTLLGVTLLQCCMREAGRGSLQYRVPNIGSLEGVGGSLESDWESSLEPVYV